MESFAVLLRSYHTLPHLDLAGRAADVLGVHLMDASKALRTQQGIVWENLSRKKADKLGYLLIEMGFPSGLVPQHDVVQLGGREVCKNADVVERGLEIEDGFRNKRVLDPGWFELAQVGWVKEEEKPYRQRTSTRIRLRSGPRGSRKRQFVRVTVPSTGDAGWVLNLFGHGDPPEWIQIHSPNFNYDYLPETPPSWRDAFRLFLNDLANVVPEHKRDAGFRIARSLRAGAKAPDETAFSILCELNERGRWALTILRTLGKLA